MMGQTDKFQGLKMGSAQEVRLAKLVAVARVLVDEDVMLYIILMFN